MLNIELIANAQNERLLLPLPAHMLACEKALKASALHKAEPNEMQNVNAFKKVFGNLKAHKKA